MNQQPTPEEILRDVPRLLRHRPTRSIVAHNIHTDETTSVLRVNLPAPAESPEAAQITLTTVLGSIADLHRTSLVVYTDTTWTDATAHATNLHTISAALVDGGLILTGTIIQTTDGWGRPGENNPHPTPQSAGRAPGIRDAARLPSTTADQRRTFHHALAVGRGRTLHTDANGPQDTAALADAALTAYDIPHAAYLMTRLLYDPDARTTALHTLTWGTLEPTPPRPDPRRLGRAIELTRTMAALAETPAARALALDLTAHLYFAAGNTTLADAYLAHTLSLDPDHEHAEHLSALIDAGSIPSWSAHPIPA